MHIDMDYFFAQVEERENPQFKGMAVVVGADPKEGRGRGVVSTCNYKARDYGIRSGMPISRAYKLNPDAIFLPVNMSLYQKTSSSIFKIIWRDGIRMEKVSLDEAYFDLTKKCKNFQATKEMGEGMRKEILKKEKLTSTIGISGNKMLAKIACELAKPNGIKIIYPSNSVNFIADLEIEKIPGIGPKTKRIIEVYLKRNNPKIKDARRIKKKELINLLGKRGGDFYKKFRGIDESIVEENKEVKSVGKEYTFENDTRSPEEITRIFRELVFSVAETIKKEKLVIKAVVVVCRFEDFETHTKQVSFPFGIYENSFLYKKSIPLLLRFLMENNKKIRLIGFRVVVK